MPSSNRRRACMAFSAVLLPILAVSCTAASPAEAPVPGAGSMQVAAAEPDPFPGQRTAPPPRVTALPPNGGPGGPVDQRQSTPPIPPVELCNRSECGLAPGMPNWQCADGTGIGGPRCVRRDNGQCVWNIHQCPTR